MRKFPVCEDPTPQEAAPFFLMPYTFLSDDHFVQRDCQSIDEKDRTARNAQFFFFIRILSFRFKTIDPPISLDSE